MACDVAKQKDSLKTKEDLALYYTDEHFRGSGAFGNVHVYGIKQKYDHTELRKRIAVKSIREDDSKTANREISILSKLTHEPHVVTMIGHSRSPGSPYLIFMECCNSDLHTYVRNRKFALGQRDLFKIIKDMLRGLIALMQHGVIHRDVKPSNFLVDFCGSDGFNIQELLFKLCDFGCGRPIRLDKFKKGEYPELTKNWGTDGYNAPELFLLQADDLQGLYTYLVDIWGFGATLLWIVSGGKRPLTEDFLRRLEVDINSVPKRNSDIEAKIRECVPDSFQTILSIILEVLQWKAEDRKSPEQVLTLVEYFEKHVDSTPKKPVNVPQPKPVNVTQPKPIYVPQPAFTSTKVTIPNEAKVKKLLGHEGYDVIMDWCNEDSINATEMLLLAKNLDPKGRLHADTEKQMENNAMGIMQVHFRKMLSMWYKMYGNISIQRLIEGLNDPEVHLKGLAMELSNVCQTPVSTYFSMPKKSQRSVSSDYYSQTSTPFPSTTNMSKVSLKNRDGSPALPSKATSCKKCSEWRVKVDHLEEDKECLELKNISHAEKIERLEAVMIGLKTENEALKKKINNVRVRDDTESDEGIFKSGEENFQPELQACEKLEEYMVKQGGSPHQLKFGDSMSIRTDDFSSSLDGLISSKLEEVTNSMKVLNLKQDQVIQKVDKLDKFCKRQDESTTDIASAVEEIKEDLNKSLHRPSLDTVLRSVKKIGDDVKAVQKTEDELAVRVKDSVDEIKKVHSSLSSISSSMTPTGTDRVLEPAQLMFEKLPHFDGIVLAGDRNLDLMKTRMADVIFDLLPRAKFVTNKTVKCGQFVTFGSYGPMLGEVNSSTRILIISVGKDDLMQDPAICTGATAQWVTPQTRQKANLKVVNTVVERIDEILQKVSNEFPDLKVFYIAPPPSMREADLCKQFRESIKKLAIFQKVTHLDIADLLTGRCETWEETDGDLDPGCLTWPACRLMMNMVYTAIFPDSEYTFCLTCAGIHEVYCPGSDFMTTGSTKPILDRDQCWFCYQRGHRSANCSTKESFRMNNVWCPHCGASPEKLVHHPDFCQGRFSVCEVCDQVGHKTSTHSNPTVLKKVFGRLGFNLIVKDVVDEIENREEPTASKRRRMGKVQEEPSKSAK